VHDVSFSLQRAKSRLLGRTAQAKPLVFYLVTGLVTPDSGTIILDGLERHQLPDVPQGPAWPRLLRRKPRFFAAVVEDKSERFWKWSKKTPTPATLC